MCRDRLKGRNGRKGGRKIRVERENKVEILRVFQREEMEGERGRRVEGSARVTEGSNNKLNWKRTEGK